MPWCTFFNTQSTCRKKKSEVDPKYNTTDWGAFDIMISSKVVGTWITGGLDINSAIKGGTMSHECLSVGMIMGWLKMFELIYGTDN